MEKTLQNLAKAFIGESQARNRYTYYSTVAKNEGYEEIGAIFEETANQEKTHAKKVFEMLQVVKNKLGRGDATIKVEVEAPTIYGKTLDNLKAAIAGETYEYTEMYPDFAKVAKEEGLDAISLRLGNIAKAEEHHAERYSKLAEQIANGTIFNKEVEAIWICRECGYVHVGKTPPEKCPACDHPKAFYQLKKEIY